MPTCTRCGEENPERARFCLSCGSELAPARPQEERKIVSVLFVDLVGFTSRADEADPEDVRATLAPYHARVRDEIELFGGSVEKFVGDAIMAVFGAPVAHEDDAERAVRAGLRVLEATAELGLAARAAVNTGEALVALGARPALGEALVAGDVVNTAARLQTAAPAGTLVVGDLTYRTTRDQIDYVPLDPVAVKGKAETVPLWRAASARGRFGVDVEIGGTTPFVGREHELALLQETYTRVRSEAAVQLVTVVGEPGVGKTRLVHELARWLDEQPDLLYWRQGRCLPYGDGITFWALGEIVKAHAGILDSDDREQVAARLAASVQAVAAAQTEQDWIRARLAPLVGLAGDVAAGRDESFTAWRSYLEAIAAQRPLVLLVEDLHWADAALLEFLDHVLTWSLGVPLLVLCTARPELYERRPTWGGGKRNSTTVSLSPLPADDTARLLHALLDRTVLRAETQALLLERCGGNPLYAEQFARMLADSPAEIAVPETVKAVIAARLDALGPERKALLQDAAVVGKVFWAEAVAALGGRDEHETMALLVDLAHKDLVRPARASSLAGRREFAFTHLLVRDVAYGQIPRAERVTRHRRAAEWLEATIPERLTDHAELLSYHYGEALELARAAGTPPDELEPLRSAAVRFLALAAKRTADLDVELASSLYGRALELARDEESAPLLIQAALNDIAGGKITHGRERLEAAAVSLREREDEEQLLLALTHLSGLRFMSAQSGSEELRDEALALLERHPDAAGAADLVTAVAGELMMRERSEDCLAACERALPVVLARGEGGHEASVLQYRGIARVTLGDLSGMDDLRSALDQSLALGQGHATGVAYVNLAYWVWWIEGAAAGAAIYEEGIDFCERRGMATSARWAEAELIWTLFELGRWDEVLARVEPLATWSRNQGSEAQLVMTAPVQARILLERGAVAGAAALQDELLEARASDVPQVIVPALTVAAAIAAARGERRGACRLLAELEERTRGRTRSRAIEIAAAARVAAAVGELAAVERILADPYPPLPRAEAAHVSATAAVAEAAGEAARAAGLYRDAAARWAALGAVPERAYALLGAGRCGSDETALAEARTLFRELGAAPRVAEVEALLDGGAAALAP